jgi:hypothetical protein
MTFNPSDYADIDPTQFAAMVKSASIDQLEAASLTHPFDLQAA